MRRGEGAHRWAAVAASRLNDRVHAVVPLRTDLTVKVRLAAAPRRTGLSCRHAAICGRPRGGKEWKWTERPLRGLVVVVAEDGRRYVIQLPRRKMKKEEAEAHGQQVNVILRGERERGRDEGSEESFDISFLRDVGGRESRVILMFKRGPRR
jgi:hypothetical protein